GMCADANGDAPDGRLSQVLAAYLEAVDAGWAPPREEFVARYPDLAADLEAYFLGQEQLARMAESLPQAAPVEQGGSGAMEATVETPTAPPSSVPTDPWLDGVGSFGDYEIRGEIARGGMGIVFRAYQKSLGREVALKMIRAGQFVSAEEV